AWAHEPFHVPDDELAAWRAAGQRSKQAHADWKKRLAALDAARRAEFERRMLGRLPTALGDAVKALKQSLAATPKDIATRSSSEFALESLIPAVGDDRRLGRSHRLEQYPHQVDEGDHGVGLLRPLHPLRRARARHGGGHERHGAARR